MVMHETSRSKSVHHYAWTFFHPLFSILRGPGKVDFSPSVKNVSTLVSFHVDNFKEENRKIHSSPKSTTIFSIEVKCKTEFCSRTWRNSRRLFQTWPSPKPFRTTTSITWTFCLRKTLRHCCTIGFYEWCPSSVSEFDHLPENVNIFSTRRAGVAKRVIARTRTSLWGKMIEREDEQCAKCE